jgi:hypothetical protein
MVGGSVASGQSFVVFLVQACQPVSRSRFSNWLVALVKGVRIEPK